MSVLIMVDKFMLSGKSDDIFIIKDGAIEKPSFNKLGECVYEGLVYNLPYWAILKMKSHAKET